MLVPLVSCFQVFKSNCGFLIRKIIVIIIIIIEEEEKKKTALHIIFDRRRWHVTAIAVLAGSNILMTFYIVSFVSNDISFKQSVITKVK